MGGARAFPARAEAEPPAPKLAVESNGAGWARDLMISVHATAPGTITHSASIVSADPPDPNTANNSASDTDTITFKADLKVTISDGKTATAAGQKDTYTIVLTNLGPTNVAGAVIQDNFPATFAGVTFTATQTGGASGFSASGSGNINDTVTMPAGSKIIYKASGTISASATGSLSNTATVTSPTGVPDPNSANNSATDTDTI